MTTLRPATRTDGPIALLRQATAASHESLDRHFDAVSLLADSAHRPAVLQRYHRLHDAAERAMRPHLQAAPGLDFARRCRTAQIARGLRGLGAEAPAPAAALDVATPAAALGVLYVTEGSTLGGRLILRRLRELGADPASLEFLDPYGDDAGAMWRQLTGTIDRSLAADDAGMAQAVAGALSAFDLARDCLVPVAA